MISLQREIVDDQSNAIDHQIVDESTIDQWQTFNVVVVSTVRQAIDFEICCRVAYDEVAYDEIN